ncbi:TetR/AcrR family transcriptional regulator [Jiella pelagia]|uniref:Helix-turn-helix domain containing protein n=1 Tax=Jiella pelagia TaxID=2986949 RepID=A0ABY7BU69_9HYPH|nr:helix-turn-helix domain-containing protein [Jiella pelagia]WAP66836.1 helix-turn-helix domain containing protein [Jiella pelagia]
MTLGYGETSIDLIVHQAKISKKTFYARFANKDELFEAVCLQIVEERFVGAGFSMVEGGDLAERLETVALQLLEQALQPEITTFYHNLLVMRLDDSRGYRGGQ